MSLGLAGQAIQLGRAGAPCRSNSGEALSADPRSAKCSRMKSWRPIADHYSSSTIGARQLIEFLE